jgi:hypothetical protein
VVIVPYDIGTMRKILQAHGTELLLIAFVLVVVWWTCWGSPLYR